ncbi:MAG: hypothetical protein HYW86_04030 [Candidatus Roizmanbacteria bacterium]|nr:MAG: hypothetical protein HYW86_04030 [Candidatus Roizmanbacteria bacterium]
MAVSAEKPNCFLTLRDLRPSGQMIVQRPVDGFVEDRSYRLKAEGRKEVYFPAIDAMVSRGWYLTDRNRSKGFPLLVVGAGDGADYLKADHHISAAMGCEVDRSKFIRMSRGKEEMSLAEYNIRKDPFLASRIKKKDIYISIDRDDGVHYLQAWRQEIADGGKELFDGRFQSFLPQSKSTVISLADSFSHSHAYDSNEELYEPYKEPWDNYGLVLYAAVLTELRKIVTPRTEALVVMSNRIPDGIIANMVQTAGWDASEAVVTKTVRHDIDTDVSWMVGAFDDDGERFEDKGGNKLTVEEASRRVSKIMKLAKEMAQEVIQNAGHVSELSPRQKNLLAKKTISRFQKDLNVYEHMTAYRLVPLKQAA